MERKTKVSAEEGKQELIITREFDLPLDLLFKAHVEPEIVAQWMGTNVLQLESRKFGAYQFETCDPQGNVIVRLHGVFAEFIPNQRITRTFEMQNAVATPFQFAVQLEFMDFQSLTDETSMLTMQIVYKSVEIRDQMLSMPFAQGINMAHNRLEQVVHNLK